MTNTRIAIALGLGLLFGDFLAEGQHSESPLKSSSTNPLLDQFNFEDQEIWIAESDIFLPKKDYFILQHQSSEYSQQHNARFQYHFNNIKSKFRVQRNFGKTLLAGGISGSTEKIDFALGNITFRNSPAALGNQFRLRRPSSALDLLPTPLHFAVSSSSYQPSQLWGGAIRKTVGSTQLSSAVLHAPINQTTTYLSSVFHPFSVGFFQSQLYFQNALKTSHQLFIQQPHGAYFLSARTNSNRVQDLYGAWVLCLDRWADLGISHHQNFSATPLFFDQISASNLVLSITNLMVDVYPKRRVSFNVIAQTTRRNTDVQQRYWFKAYQKKRRSNLSLASMFYQNELRNIRFSMDFDLSHSLVKPKFILYQQTLQEKTLGYFFQLGLKLHRRLQAVIGHSYNPPENGIFYHYQSGPEYQWNLARLGANKSHEFIYLNYKKESLKIQYKSTLISSKENTTWQQQIQAIYLFGRR